VGVQPNVGVAASRIYASELLSSTMVTDQNAELGVVEDVVINLRDRQVQYLALSPAGVLGIGEQYHAVPMRVFVGLDRNARQLIVQLRAENFARDEGFSPEGSWPLQASAQLGDISPRTEDDRTFFGFPDERTTDDDSNKTPGEDNGSSTSPAAEPEPDAQVNRSSDNEDDENATPAEEPTPPPAAEPDTRVNKFFDAEDDENATPAEEPTPPPAAEPDTRVNKFFDAEDDENN
jgi:sporulation protein YlmC with PRC-barrel domain